MAICRYYCLFRGSRLGAFVVRHRGFKVSFARHLSGRWPPRQAVLGGLFASCILSYSAIKMYGHLVVNAESTTRLVLDRAGMPTSLFDTDTVHIDSTSGDVLYDLRRQMARMILEPLASLWETTMMALRALRLFATFAPLICLYVPVYFLPFTQHAWWSLVLNTIESSGPVFIKLGQWASTRRDLFSADFCDQFSRLQRSVRPHSWKFTCRQLDEALGPDWRQTILFDGLDANGNETQPIGSGCVAQVYKARIRIDRLMAKYAVDYAESEQLSPSKPSWTLYFNRSYFRKTLQEGFDNVVIRLLALFQKGHLRPSVEGYSPFRAKRKFHVENTNLLPVAVKVLHPDIHVSFRRDLAIMKTFVDLAEILFPGLHWINLSRCVEEFGNVMKKQIDLAAEARNLDLFARNFSDVPSVRFPVPVHPFVSERVLVETFEEGEQMLQYTRRDSHQEEDDDLETAAKRDQLKASLADIGLDAVFKMVFQDNFVHGDLHPGNILVQNTSAANNKTRLVFLDCGITASLEGSDMENMLSVFEAVITRDGERVGSLFLKHTRDHRCANEVAFKKDMAKIVQDFHRLHYHSEEVSVSTVIAQLFGTLMHHRVQLEGNFAIVILSMMIIEGLGRSLKPQMDVLNNVAPFLVAARIRRFNS